MRSCLAPHGEISTSGLVHRVLQQSSPDVLMTIERQLLDGVKNHTLPSLGKNALKQVRRELARRQLHAVFGS